MTTPTPLSMIGDPDAAGCKDGVCAVPAAQTDADRDLSAQ
jgi:hypothetical protein